MSEERSDGDEHTAAVCTVPVWRAHLHGWTEHMAGGGRCGWFSMVTVFLTWSWLMSSYICSTVRGCLSWGTRQLRNVRATSNPDPAYKWYKCINIHTEHWFLVFCCGGLHLLLEFIYSLFCWLTNYPSLEKNQFKYPFVHVPAILERKNTI